MNWLTQTIGVGLIIIAAIDIFMTVLYPRTGNSIVSLPLGRGTWHIFRWLARWIKSDRLMAYCGSVVLVVVAIFWIALFIIGFALVVWSMLGDEIVASSGKTPTDFGTAIYYSGFNFTTLGIGDLVPQSTICRLLTILQAGLGFATFTVTLTYLLSVLNALTQRNLFALSLHHRTGTKANATELLLSWGIGGEFDNAKQDITSMARDLLQLLESHNSYPVLHYFRFPELHYSLARMILITMDTATLIKTALCEREYKSLIHSTAVIELQSSGLYTLKQLADSFLPQSALRSTRCGSIASRQTTIWANALSVRLIVSHSSEAQWREWYYHVVRRLQSEGIKTLEDIEAGADEYVSLRREWNDEVAAFAKHMAYRWSDIAPAESQISASDYSIPKL